MAGRQSLDGETLCSTLNSGIGSGCGYKRIRLPKPTVSVTETRKVSVIETKVLVVELYHCGTLNMADF